MTKSLKVSLALIAAAVLVFVGSLVVSQALKPPAAPPVQNANPLLSPPLVRDDSPRLSQGSEAVFVEFLDFECEGCLALYPVVEDLRARYGDRVTFVVRYLPLHGNSVNAALAAEAAREQGKFEQMYKKLFESVGAWGHQQTSQEDMIIGYAESLGLDMAKFRTTFKDPATMARIQQSQADAQTLEVSGTPTVFLNGQRIELSTAADLQKAFDDALR